MNQSHSLHIRRIEIGGYPGTKDELVISRCEVENRQHHLKAFDMVCNFETSVLFSAEAEPRYIMAFLNLFIDLSFLWDCLKITVNGSAASAHT